MGMADVVKSLPEQPGKDFIVLTISVNDGETPSDARKVKKIGLESLQKPFPEASWRFLMDERDIDHPLGLVVLSLEASTGTIGPTISKVMRFCFRVDPASHTLVFNALKVTATVTLLIALALVLYLVVSGRKRRAKGKA